MSQYDDNSGDSRRSFFRQLAVAGAPVAQWPQSRNRRVKHADTVLYRGPMRITADVIDAVAAHPALAKTTHRHLVARWDAAESAEMPSINYRFRCPIPEHAAATPAETYKTPMELIEAGVNQ